ncbi:MAG: hypothetical protein HYX78_06240 [Armatimonadetes bacterium]|nr:hypothetical protein [Armatimonadota bacterium]
MLLKQFASYVKSNRNASSFRVALWLGSEDEPGLPAAEPNIAPEEPEIVEGTGLAVRPVGRPDGTLFTHFLDGAQTARRIGFYDYTAPVVYGFIGAVIRKRDADRHMSTHDKDYRENLYFSFAFVDPNDLRKAGIEPVDVAVRGKGSSDESEAHPLRLQELARSAVSNARAEMERDLAERWIAGSRSDEWLCWDGSISGRSGTSKHPRIIGVIKSHQTQYFRAEEQRKVLSLGVGERSSVFQPKGYGWSPVYSWYLRLHPNEGRDIYFGLVRVEAAATPETIAMADEVSRWLLAERSPLSLPDSRWDRMLYPIRDCEQYLKSIAPSRVMIEASLAGL